jgi:hypothetical protein
VSNREATSNGKFLAETGTTVIKLLEVAHNDVVLLSFRQPILCVAEATLRKVNAMIQVGY